ncbi:hypothetical protein DPEC_G00082340 [Dallia pectoralis]|uniref:Uncharacterized protein n=1 Tax=Dallia pectoralis TaxID=75939 RepID=A0ACC2GZI2_DALPE|nr:hypothetical protein DPEC_G00082340 [Dallia pectoralis]
MVLPKENLVELVQITRPHMYISDRFGKKTSFENNPNVRPDPDAVWSVWSVSGPQQEERVWGYSEQAVCWRGARRPGEETGGIGHSWGNNSVREPWSGGGTRHLAVKRRPGTLMATRYRDQMVF